MSSDEKLNYELKKQKLKRTEGTKQLKTDSIQSHLAQRHTVKYGRNKPKDCQSSPNKAIRCHCSHRSTTNKCHRKGGQFPRNPTRSTISGSAPPVLISPSQELHTLTGLRLCFSLFNSKLRVFFRLWRRACLTLSSFKFSFDEVKRKVSNKAGHTCFFITGPWSTRCACTQCLSC